MTKYNFSVDGIPVAIYPLSDTEEVGKMLLTATDDGAIRVALLSDPEADYRIVCFDKSNTEPREPHLSLAALSCFLSRVRGYPDMSLDVAYHGGAARLTLDKLNDYNFSVNNEKCKIICAKTVDFLDGTSLRLDVVDSPFSCACLLLEDAELFDRERLTLVLDRLRRDGVSAIVLASLGTGLCLRTAGDISPYAAVRVVTSLLSARGIILPEGHAEATVNGTRLKFARTRTRLAFYPEIKYIS